MLCKIEKRRVHFWNDGAAGPHLEVGLERLRVLEARRRRPPPARVYARPVLGTGGVSF
jgi:hypothetical protein